MTLTRAILLLWLALLALATPRTSSAESIPDSLAKPNIRITEPWLRQLFAAGMSRSPTFRSLIERLDQSDVVVYVQRDLVGSTWMTGMAGRVTFLSAVGETRYVVIQLTPLRSVVQQLAMIGHELQHAVEVAENAAIVDSESMYREYLRIGHLNGMTESGVAVDTTAAVAAGERINDELHDAAFVFPAALLR
jgi:hypothetical protein